MIGNKLEPFKFWCQKVLPNVYDDSLSYYEYLCKLNEYLNEVIEQINTLTDNMEDYEEDLTATWLETKEYIDNYFDNLDVQQEINNKLDVMAESGALSTLLAPIVGTQIGGVVADQIGNTVANQIGGTVANQIDDVVASQISEPTATAVTAWLNANVDPVGSAVVVDETLSISGAAADAKIVGDLCSQKRGSKQVTLSKIRFVPKYEVNPNTGDVEYDGESYWCASDFIPIPKGTKYIEHDRENWSGNINYNAFYDNNFDYISGLSFHTNKNRRTYVPENACYIRLSLKTTDRTYITLTFYDYIDEIELAKNTFVIQGNYSNYIEQNNQTTIVITPSAGGNVGYYNGNNVSRSLSNYEIYIKPSSDVTNNTYTLNRYQAIVADLALQEPKLKIKDLYSIKESDLVLFAYGSNNYISKYWGLIYERMSRHYAEIEIVAKDTFVFQGTFSEFTTQSNQTSITITPNSAGNVGYYSTPTSSTEIYVKPSTDVIDNVYTINRWEALIVDLSLATPRLKIKEFNTLQPYDLVIFAYSTPSYPSNYWGILYERLCNSYAYANKMTRVGNDDNVMRAICRSTNFSLPETPESIKSAYNIGYNIYRSNLQFTYDGVPVLWHDVALNRNYQNVYDANGDLVVYTEETAITISEHTLVELNQYRYGSATAPLGIPKAEKALSICKKLGMELYFECKSTPSVTNIQTIFELINKYGMNDKVSFACSNSFAVNVATYAPKTRVGLMPESLGTSTRSTFESLVALTDKVFWFGWNTHNLTSEEISFLGANGIEYEVGDFTSLNAVDTYLNATYNKYTTGVELQGSFSPLIGQHIKQNALS